jgi:hypothetical protein
MMREATRSLRLLSSAVIVYGCVAGASVHSVLGHVDKLTKVSINTLYGLPQCNLRENISA